MSEAELHVLRARLRGGILNTASRAALKLPLPIDLAYAEDDTVVLDPDAQIRAAVGLLFTTFKRTGSATVKAFCAQGLLFPHRVRTGLHKGEVHWGPLHHSTTLKILRNPRYAGAFCGRRAHVPPHTLMAGPTPWSSHGSTGNFWCKEFTQALSPGTTTKPIFGNSNRIARQTREDRRHGPAREGPALLQGLVVCGRCGNRMTLRSYQRKHGTRLYPEYLCQKEQIEQAGDHLCRASCLGRAWMRPLLTCCWHNSRPWPSTRACMCTKNCTPRRSRRGDCALCRSSGPGSAAELARRRFLQVDPGNRLVASVLEADWNARLRELAQIQQEVEKQNDAEQQAIAE